MISFSPIKQMLLVHKRNVSLKETSERDVSFTHQNMFYRQLFINRPYSLNLLGPKFNSNSEFEFSRFNCILICILGKNF